MWLRELQICAFVFLSQGVDQTGHLGMGLVYAGARIEATFSDREFIGTHSVRRGDRLKVRMSVEYEHKETGEIRPTYDVLKVLEHVRSPSDPFQSSLLS